AGKSVYEISDRSGIAPWCISQMQELVQAEQEFGALDTVTKEDMRRMKRFGFSDRQLAVIRGMSGDHMRRLPWELEVRPAYKMVDTCAGEFPSATPYLYSSYDEE